MFQWIQLCQRQQSHWMKVRLFWISFQEYTNFVQSELFTGSTWFSVNCLFFKQKICEKTGGKLCDITHSIFDTSTRKTGVFSYGANFHDKTAAASYKYLLLKVETRINRAIFPPLLQLACDLQSQFTALNYMQRVAPVNPWQTHSTPTFASNLTLKWK